ncbi:MAG: hypothetical protein ACJAVV_002326 [Alphaproteobacteria bacterium]|jgi:hypothetical protein
MKNNKYLIACTTVLVILLAACSSEKEKSLEDLDAQLNAPVSTNLVFVNDGEYWRPAKKTDNKVLESNPPQINIRYEHNQAVDTVALSTVADAPLLNSSAYIAEYKVGDEWQSVANFKFESSQFLVQQTPDSNWQEVASNNIRLRNK